MNKILIVDDDKRVAELVALAVARRGYHPVIACGGAAAVARLKVERFDMMICDRDMPDVNGLEVLKLAKKLYAGMPVLMLTGDRTAAFISESKAEGAYAVLAKPVGIENLLSVINLAIAARRRRRELYRSREALGVPA